MNHNGANGVQEREKTGDITVHSLRVIGACDCGLLVKLCAEAGILCCPRPEEVIRFCVRDYFNGHGEAREVSNGYSFFSKIKKKSSFSASEVLGLLLKHRGMSQNGSELRILDPFHGIAFFKANHESLRGLSWFLPGMHNFREGDQVPALTWIGGGVKLVMTKVEVDSDWSCHWTFPSGVFSTS